jgi:hypothetical protein
MIEYGIKLPPSVMHKIDAFFRDDHSVTDQINPFNRHDIDITAKFHLDTVTNRPPVLDGVYYPENEVKSTDAFYYEEFRRDLARNNWRPDTTSYPFRVRFSPQEIGDYTYNRDERNSNYNNLCLF